MRPSYSIPVLVSTFFYAGYLPLIPGTFASLVALALIYSLHGNSTIHLLLTVIFTAAGFVWAGQAEKVLGRKDCRYIVIDEISGMFLSLLFLGYGVRILITAFLLFRILDTLKPYPAGVLQKLKGSLGVMSDDLIAGLYTNIILQIALRLASFIAS